MLDASALPAGFSFGQRSLPEEFEATIPAEARFTLRAYLIMATADMPARDKLMGVRGYNSNHHCSYCAMTGVSSHIHVYAPLSPPIYNVPADKQAYIDSCTNYRTGNLFQMWQTQRAHDDMRAAAELAEAPFDTRHRTPSPLWRLDSMVWPYCFPVDAMHLFYLNVANRMKEHWAGCFFKSAVVDEQLEGYYLTERTWRDIDEDIARMNTPTCFGDKFRCMKDIHKANELKTWVKVVSPIVLRGRLPTVYYDHWMLFVEAVTLATDYSIHIGPTRGAARRAREQARGVATGDDVARIGELMLKFVTGYEDLYYRRDYRKLSACRSVFHALLHVECTLQWHGPMWSYSQWTCERMAGLWKGLVSQRNHLVDRNLTMSLLRIAQGHAVVHRLDLGDGQALDLENIELRHDESIWTVMIQTAMRRQSRLRPATFISSEQYTATLHTIVDRSAELRGDEVRNLRRFLDRDGSDILPPEHSAETRTYVSKWRRCMLRKHDAEPSSFRAFIRGADWESATSRDSSYVLYRAIEEGPLAVGRVKYFIAYETYFLAYVEDIPIEVCSITQYLRLYKRGQPNGRYTGTNRRFVNVDNISGLVGMVASMGAIYFVTRTSCSQ